MGVRAYINQNLWIGYVAGIAGILLALASLWYSETSASRAANALTQAWFSDDDGATWFADSQWMIPPFDHNGKMADRAYIYSCNGAKSPFCAFLSRFTPAAKKALDDAHQAARDGKAPPPAGLYERLASTSLEFKKPGQSTWVNIQDPRVALVRKIDCPPGSNVQAVLP